MSMNWKEGVEPTVDCQGAKDGRTKQSPAAGADINAIVKQYRTTGFLNNARSSVGVFMDVSKMPDFHGMVKRVRAAQESFDLLPSALRARFHNDPSELIAFVSDSSNKPEAIKLGLVPAPAPVVPKVVLPAKGVDPKVLVKLKVQPELVPPKEVKDPPGPSV